MQDSCSQRTKVWKGLSAFSSFFIFFLFSSQLVFAQPPFEGQASSNPGNLVLLYPKVSSFELDGAIDFHFHVLNSTGFLVTNATTSCYGHVYDDRSRHIIQQKLAFDNTLGGGEFELVGAPSNATGQYSYNVWCNSTNGEGGFASGAYEVIKKEDLTSRESTPQALSIGFFYGIALLIAIVILTAGLYLSDPNMVALSGIIFMIAGVYTLINGYGGYKSLLVSAFATVVTGIGFYLFVVPLMEKGVSDLNELG